MKSPNFVKKSVPEQVDSLKEDPPRDPRFPTFYLLNDYCKYIQDRSELGCDGLVIDAEGFEEFCRCSRQSNPPIVEQETTND